MSAVLAVRDRSARDLAADALAVAVAKVLRELHQRINALEADLASMRRRSVRGFEIRATEEPRRFVLRLLVEEGEPIESQFDIRIPLHLGKWHSDRWFGVNDEVAWGGCTWIASANTRGEEPGKNAKWLLVAKQGRRGDAAQ